MTKTILSAMAAAILIAALAGCETSGPSASTTDALGRPHETLYGPVKVHYVTAGSGAQTVVFVHCWAGNLTFWRNEVPALRDKARLILIDLPGHGLSDKPHTNYTMDYFAGAVLAVMKDAGVDKATLIGHSMGTPIICRVYAQAPEKVAGLVAVDGMLRRPATDGDGAAQFMAPFSKSDYLVAVTNLVKSMFPVPGTEVLRDETTAELLKTPQYVMTSSMNGMFGADQTDWTLHHVTVPVIAIDTDNPMWTEDYKSYMRSLSPMTDYRVIAGAGHWLMLEKPEEFNLALQGSLRKFGLIAP